LLVEDDPMVRQLAEQILLSVGYKVLLAENGAEALQLAEQYEGTIHLMISDFVMPGMNGHELAEQMKLIRQETKIVYMSGYTEKAMGNSNVVIPTKQMLHKPFTVESLTQKVREGLDGSHH
jgi:CheY-like chemotaxis protein